MGIVARRPDVIGVEIRLLEFGHRYSSTPRLDSRVGRDEIPERHPGIVGCIGYSLVYDPTG